MSADEQMPTITPSTTEAAVTTPALNTDAALIEQERSEKILTAKELYSHGSRNFLVKSYAEAADELSDVCALYEELYGELSDELGMPYLLYAKSLIALALDENKVIDVPDEEEDDDDEEDEVDEENDEKEMGKNGTENGVSNASATETTDKTADMVKKSTNGEAKDSTKLDTISEVENKKKEKSDEADSTADDGDDAAVVSDDIAKITSGKAFEEAQVSSTNDGAIEKSQNGNKTGDAAPVVVIASAAASSSSAAAMPVMDGEKPSTSNGDTENIDGEEEENEAASSLQLAWEILELAAKIFKRQGINGLPNLAEVHTELANIEFENNILEAAREDYETALKIYGELATNYRRARAEINYKIGLTYLMQQLNKEGAESLKQACQLIEDEIEEIKGKSNELSEKEKNNIQDMEETKQEIWAKISEIEDTQAQNVAEVRAALDSYIKPIKSVNAAGAGTSSSAAATTASLSAVTLSNVIAGNDGIISSSSSSAAATNSKPTDISHLIKRKKPEEPNSEAEAAQSPAKRPAV